jgi:hypothetical protein
MVTVMKFGKALRDPFRYNENKVAIGMAQFIHSANYGKDTNQLSGKDRITRLKKQAILNERATLKSVHITLNFDPSEKIDKDTLQQIVDGYMKRIGYAAQPYIVYRHTEAGHPHVHIVTTNIRPDGTRIHTHNNRGKFLPELARQAIEQEFGLVRASDHGLHQAHQNTPFEPPKVLYGKSETRRAVTTVLDAILERHQYTSLAELNAILRKYNVMADNGGEHSRIRQGGGLVYRVLDDHGKKVGAPIKASDIDGKPTLKFLEKQFARNAKLRQTANTQNPKLISLAELIPHPTLPVHEENTKPEEECQKRQKKKRKRLHL